MAHELSTVKTGSGYAIVCIGDAWHGLQNAFTGDAQTDLAQAGLDFEAIKLPLFHQLPETIQWAGRERYYSTNAPILYSF